MATIPISPVSAAPSPATNITRLAIGPITGVDKVSFKNSFSLVRPSIIVPTISSSAPPAPAAARFSKEF